MNEIELSAPSTLEPAVDRVVAALTAMIGADLQPGGSLPSEARLAEEFQVSRLTVREAIKLLSGRGLLEVARGRRAVVREPNGSAFGHFLAATMRHDAKSFFDLIEVRQALEIQSATLAAKRANRAGLAAVETALAGMRQAIEDARDPAERPAAEDRFNRWDVGFHEALALSSGNRMLTNLLEAMAAPLAQSFKLSMRGRELRGFPMGDALSAHEVIFACVRDGDGRGAALAMRNHLKDAERDLRVALATRLTA